jgi:hypothetical protein
MLLDESQRFLVGLIVAQHDDRQPAGAGRQVRGSESLLLGTVDAAPGAEPVKPEEVNSADVSRPPARAQRLLIAGDCRTAEEAVTQGRIAAARLVPVPVVVMVAGHDFHRQRRIPEGAEDALELLPRAVVGQVPGNDRQRRAPAGGRCENPPEPSEAVGPVPVAGRELDRLAGITMKCADVSVGDVSQPQRGPAASGGRAHAEDSVTARPGVLPPLRALPSGRAPHPH